MTRCSPPGSRAMRVSRPAWSSTRGPACPSTSALVTSIDQAPLIVICAPEAASARRDGLERAGAEVIVATGRNDQARLEAALDELGRREIQDLLVEGGPTFAGALFDAGEIDADAALHRARLHRRRRGSRRPGGRPVPCGSPTGFGRWRPASSRSARTCWSGRGCGSGEALMFTGIIKELGSVAAVEASDDGARLRIRAELASELEPGRLGRGQRRLPDGDLRRAGASSSADVMHQTLALTTLGELEPGPRGSTSSCRCGPTDRLGGHVVQGHVDGTADGRRTSRPTASPSACGSSCRTSCCPYVVERGSIAIEGVSLTIADLAELGPGGLADPRDARAHDPGSARARRPGQRRVRRPRPLRPAPAAHRSRHVTLIK